jgi:hypothetical protein
MIDEERKRKEERAENERLERKRQSDARQAIIDNEKAEKQRQIDAKKIEFEREKLAREIRQAAEDEKRRLQQESYKEWLDLRDELKLSLPSTKGRKEWLLKMKDFISRNEPIDGHQGTVTQAKEKLKEAEEKELTFSGKALRFLMNSTILLIPNIINSLTGGWWYKTTAGKPLKK